MHLLKLFKNNKFIYLTLFVILVFLGVLFSYRYIFQTYFAMDEWSQWMDIQKYGVFYDIKKAGLIGSLTGGVRFGLSLTNGIYYSLFGLNVLPWNITFLSLHLIIVFFLYIILRKFKLSPLSAFLASFYFAIASAGQETLSWPAAGMQILWSTLFIVICIFLTLRFIETNRKTFLLFAVISAYVSFLMRPTGIVTAAFIVTLIFLFYKRPNLMRIPKFVYALGFLTVAIGVGRLLTEYSDKLNQLLIAAFNIIFYPFVSLSHIFIPYRLMFRLSDSFIKFYYPVILKDSNVDTVSHLIVGDFISVVLSFFLLILIYLLYKKVNLYHKKVIIFGLIIFFLHYVVIALYYVDRSGLSYLASRHTYTSLIGISIILGVFLNIVLSKFSTKNIYKKYLVIIFLILFGAWLFKEMTVTNREVRAQAIDDIAIKKTWDSLNSLSLPNSNKVVFYLESDRSYYYPNYYLPFKLPGAYMLSLAFYRKPFMDKEILGKLQSNNTYMNNDDKQYGYFTDIKPLALLVKQGKIDINNVVGLHFIDGTYSFRDTTQQTQEKIQNELKQLEE